LLPKPQNPVKRVKINAWSEMRGHFNFLGSKILILLFALPVVIVARL